MKPSTAKAKGRETEQAFVDWLKRHGVPHAERRRLEGVDDRGDIAGLPGVVLEVKSGARLDLPGWLRELEREMANDQADMGAVIIRPKGQPDPDDWVVAMPVGLWWELMREAGYAS